MHIETTGFIVHGTEGSVRSFFDTLQARHPFRKIGLPFVHRKKGEDGPELVAFVLLSFESPGPEAGVLEQCIDEIGCDLLTHQMMATEDLLRERRRYLDNTVSDPELVRAYEAACNPDPTGQAVPVMAG